MRIESRNCVRSVLVTGVLLIASVGVSCADGRDAAKPEAKPVLQISIAVPINHGNRAIIVGRPDSHFHAVVTNISDKPVRLWREWCSQGYFNLTFRLTDANSKTFIGKKLGRGWDKNFPDYVELGADEHFVIDVYPLRDWENFTPVFTTEATKAKLQAVYEIKPDTDSKKYNVWSGRIESNAQEYVLYNYEATAPKKDK